MQVAEHPYPLLEGHPPANWIREYRNNRAHEEVVVVGGASPHGQPQVTEDDHVGRTGERGEARARGGGGVMDKLRDRGS